MSSSIPGPLGSGGNRPEIDSGTLPVTASPLPGFVGMGPGATTAALDPSIEALGLTQTARVAAYALKKAHPAVKFTSGRRSKEDQARAMAGNVVMNRNWIEQTYARSSLRSQCQEWIDANSAKTTQGEIATGLIAIFDAVADTDLGNFSKHLSGAAFDVQPVDRDAEAIKKTIRSLAGLSKFLDTEGGLVCWHAQF